MLLSILSAIALEIDSPIETVYFSGFVPLVITSSTTVGSISYGLNDGNLTLGCENCSSLNKTLSLEIGNYDLYVIASDTYNMATAVVQFSVEEEIIEENNTNTTDIDLGIEIISPVSTTYYDVDIEL